MKIITSGTFSKLWKYQYILENGGKENTFQNAVTETKVVIYNENEFVNTMKIYKVISDPKEIFSPHIYLI